MIDPIEFTPPDIDDVLEMSTGAQLEVVYAGMQKLKWHNECIASGALCGFEDAEAMNNSKTLEKYLFDLLGEMI